MVLNGLISLVSMPSHGQFLFPSQQRWTLMHGAAGFPSVGPGHSVMGDASLGTYSGETDEAKLTKQRAWYA